jgi:hypothetical protein
VGNDAIAEYPCNGLKIYFGESRLEGPSESNSSPLWSQKPVPKMLDLHSGLHLQDLR